MGAGMLCPVCRLDLVMSDRQGVEVDYCPKCRGVWLDRGELDKIIERSAAYDAPAPQSAPPTRGRDYDYRERREEYPDYERNRGDYGGYDRDRGDHGGYDRRHKKKSFLGDLFDFD